MLLVGVTINVALNGGVFDKAETAVKQTQLEVEKEELLLAIVAAIGNDGKVKTENIILPTNWEGTWTETEGTYTSPKGNTFTVTKDGKIIEGGTGSGGENEEPSEKEYTFTLNELKQGGYTFLDDDYTGIIFDAGYLWDSVIEEDLSSVENYILNQEYEVLFSIESTDGIFTDYYSSTASATANMGDYLLLTYINRDATNEFVFGVGIYDSEREGNKVHKLIVESNPVEGQMTVEEFLDEYGDVEFRFLDTSSLKEQFEE